MGVPHSTRRSNEGKNLSRKHLNMKLSERRRTFARKRRRGKRAERKTARMNQKPAMAMSRLEELTFGTFNICTEVVNGVKSIGHTDTLVRSCAAKGYNVIGLQKTERYGTSKIVASGYRVVFSGDCSEVKGRKGQYGVRLAIKENTIQKAGEDGIVIECISARLLKDPISSESNFVTFVVTYASTEEAPKGQKDKYMAALNCTVASVPTREYVFVLKDVNARTEKRGEGKGEADSKVLGAYGQHGSKKTTAGFRRRPRARSREHFILHFQKWRVLQVPKTSTAARDKLVWIIS